MPKPALSEGYRQQHASNQQNWLSQRIEKPKMQRERRQQRHYGADQPSPEQQVYRFANKIHGWDTATTASTGRWSEPTSGPVVKESICGLPRVRMWSMGRRNGVQDQAGQEGAAKP